MVVVEEVQVNGHMTAPHATPAVLAGTDTAWYANAHVAVMAVGAAVWAGLCTSVVVGVVVVVVVVILIARD